LNRPFNEAKYNALLEGLEISEIKFSELYSSIRIDAETYRPFYLEIEDSILQKNYDTLGNVTSKIKKGIFDIKSEVYTDEGVPFVRIKNLKNMLVSTDDIIYIPESENLKHLDTYLKQGDMSYSQLSRPLFGQIKV